jgi:phosphatidylserine synthase
MGELGEFLGWLTGVCFIVSVCNYVVKRVNKWWIVKLPKTSSVRKVYQTLMKLVVRYHRYFGIGAAAAVATHLFVQLRWEFPSVTGITAASLLALTAVLGIAMIAGVRSKTLLNVHRVTAAAGFAAFLVHLIFKV